MFGPVFIFGCFSQVHRHRRGSEWNESNSDYDAVASYSSRRSDVLMYPQHKAYLYSKKIGVSKLYALFAAGGFVGAADNGQNYKVSCFCTAQNNDIIVYGFGCYTLLLYMQSSKTIDRTSKRHSVGESLKMRAAVSPFQFGSCRYLPRLLGRVMHLAGLPQCCMQSTSADVATAQCTRRSM